MLLALLGAPDIFQAGDRIIIVGSHVQAGGEACSLPTYQFLTDLEVQDDAIQQILMMPSPSRLFGCRRTQST